MDEATGAASLILFLALLAIEIVMYGFGRAIQSLNSGKIQEMAEAGNKRAEQIEYHGSACGLYQYDPDVYYSDSSGYGWFLSGGL